MQTTGPVTETFLGHLSTVSDVLLLSVTDLAKKCRVVTSEAQTILDTVCSELEPQLQLLSLEDSELRQDECFTTGDAVLDRAFGGGLRTGKVWEIVGERYAVLMDTTVPPRGTNLVA